MTFLVFLFFSLVHLRRLLKTQLSCGAPCKFYFYQSLLTLGITFVYLKLLLAMVYNCPSCPLLVLPVVCTIKNFFKHHRPHISYLDWYFTPNYINERLKWFSNSGIPNWPGVLQYTDLADFADLLEVVGLPRSLYCYLRGCFTNSNLSLFDNFYFYNTISC